MCLMSETRVHFCSPREWRGVSMLIKVWKNQLLRSREIARFATQRNQPLLRSIRPHFCSTSSRNRVETYVVAWLLPLIRPSQAVHSVWMWSRSVKSSGLKLGQSRRLVRRTWTLILTRFLRTYKVLMIGVKTNMWWASPQQTPNFMIVA